MSQKDRVLKYMEDFGSITSWDAFKELNITRLSAIIFNLRAEGWDITSKTEYSENSWGEKTHYSRYTLNEPAQKTLF